MNVLINGEKVTLPANALLPDAIKAAGLELNTAAVWINGAQPMFADYVSTVLHEGDDIRIVFMCIGG